MGDYGITNSKIIKIISERLPKKNKKYLNKITEKLESECKKTALKIWKPR